MDEIEIRYANAGDVNVAYTVLGEGTTEIVCSPGPASNFEMLLDHPRIAPYFRRIASFARLAIFDRRGTGLSDAVGSAPWLEQQVEDLLAVADAAGMERPAVLGLSAACQMCCMFAASNPERVSSLVLYGSAMRPASFDPAMRSGALDAIEHAWGKGDFLDLFGPTLAADTTFRRWWARYERGAMSPGMARRLYDVTMSTDLSSVAPAIGVPTLVLHRTGDRVAGIEGARELAAAIPGARMVELPGDDHLSYAGDSDAIIDEIEEFLTGTMHSREPDRVLATVLFTDIVGSTERAAALGDRSWRELLGQHDRLADRELDRWRGRRVKSLGDGMLATFDGPARAIRCARALTESARSLGIELRAGLHTGEVEMIDSDVAGIAVHIGARVGALAGGGEVLVSGTVKDLVAGSGIDFDDRGPHELKGVPGEWRLYSVG